MRLASLVRLPFTLALLALVAGGGALSGCRPGSALHGRYNNFRAYYNTYYNAERSLEEAEASLERSGTAIDRDRLIPLFPATAATGGSSGPFQEAIDKSADLLRERPSSKWADDALLLIGKAYFYQRNVVGAEQKFNETIAAADVSEDEALRDEARFWLGRTYAAAERYDEGVAVLLEALAADGVSRRWASRMRLALGELYARAGRWGEAAETLQEGAAEADDVDLAARAYVLLGQVEEEAGRFAEAADAYALALDLQPAYELAFAAEVNRALTLGLDGGAPDEGLAVVRSMLRNDKHYERRGELALVEARLLSAAGRAADADRRFRDVLYDPDMNGQSVRGRAHYFYGRFYDDVRGDLVRAAAHFDTAATAYRAPAAVDRPSRAAILGLDDQVLAYGTLATTARQLAEADSLLALGALSEEAFRERIAAIEAERRRVYFEEQRELQAQRTAQAFSGGSGFREGGRAAPTTAASEAVQAGVEEAGFLSYRNPSSVQAGYIAFQQQWGDRPLLPNWRRLAAVQGGNTGNSVGGVGEYAQNNPFSLGQGPPPLDLSMVPRTPAKREELVTELAGLRYELANAFFLSLGRADTAAALYRLILDETPQLPVATRARYALAELELAAGRREVAEPLYRAVIGADPASDLARASRLRLGIEEDEPEQEVVVRETSAAYDVVRRRWQGGHSREAAAEFVALADAAPEAPGAARAYLAAAVAYVEAVGADSLALLAPLPSDLTSPVLAAASDSLIGASADAAVDAPASPPPAQPAEAQPAEAQPAEAQPAEGLAAADPLADSLGTVPAALAPDSLQADSLQTDSLQVSADTAAVGGVAPGLTLRQYLAALASRYPQTPFAARARTLAESLPSPPQVAEEEAAAPADSLATAAPEAVADTSDALSGAVPVDLAAGGYAWLAQTISIASEGASAEQALREAGYRTLIARDPAGGFGLLIGQFETEAEAEAARPRLPDWAQSRGEVVPLDQFRPVERGGGEAGEY